MYVHVLNSEIRKVFNYEKINELKQNYHHTNGKSFTSVLLETKFNVLWWKQWVKI